MGNGVLFLSFDDCSALGSPQGRTLDCRDSLRTTTMVASVELFASYDNVLADAGIVDVIVGSDPAALPAFWQFQRGGCAGPEALAVSPDFTGYTRCADLWLGTPSGGWQFGGLTGPTPDGNRARLKWTWAVPDFNFPASIAAGVETYVARITMGQRHIARCAGCSEFACFVYNQEEFALRDGRSVKATSADVLLFNCYLGCPTPARPLTWGQVKALYR